jgi:tagatose 6-phosphate kinase
MREPSVVLWPGWLSEAEHDRAQPADPQPGLLHLWNAIMPASSHPILCVNANPAIDKTVVLAGFTLGAIHRPVEVVATPGGKGCNVARVLHTLGEAPVVTGWIGGHAGRFIEDGLRTEGIGAAFTRARGESRTCLSLYDAATGALTEIYERGEPITPAAQAAFIRRYRGLVRQVNLVTLSGSLPPGVPPDLYAALIGLAHDAGIPVFLDSSGEPLRLGLAARPELVKPNRDELAGLMGRDLTDNDAIAAAARALAAEHGARVVVSLGRYGALMFTGRGNWQATPPRLDSLAAVGSGDALLAGLAAGWVRGYSAEDMLRLGSAAGAANTLTEGAGRARRDHIDEIMPRVIVDKLRA